MLELGQKTKHISWYKSHRANIKKHVEIQQKYDACRLFKILKMQMITYGLWIFLKQ